MKVRFAVAPHSGPLSGPGILAFVDALDARGFDGIWLSDLPVAPVLDPLPATPVESLAHEAEWLAYAILDLQT